LVFDEVVDEAMAKCPACLSFFPLNEKSLRPLPPLLVVERLSPSPDPLEVLPRAEQGTAVEWDTPRGSALDTSLANETAMETVVATPQTSGEPSSLSEKMEAWSGRAGAEADSPSLASTSSDQPQADVPSWEDVQQMGNLLDQIEPPGAQQSADLGHFAGGALIGGATSAEVASEDSWRMLSATVRGRPRKRTLLRPLAKVALGGVVGLACGYFCLLWLRGKSGDFLELAQYLPRMVLPAEFREAPKPMSGRDASPDNAAETMQPLASVDVESTQQAADAQLLPPVEIAASDSTPVAKEAADATSESAHEPSPLSSGLQTAAYESSLNAVTSATGDVRREQILIRDAPSFTAAELTAAIAAARAAQPLLMKGNLTDGREVQFAKGRGYLALADLAQKLTFVSEPAGSESLLAQRHAAEELFRSTLATDRTRGEIAQIFAKWLVSPNRRHGGVFFAANVVWQNQVGPVAEGQAKLDDGRMLTVLADSAMAEQLGTAKQVVVVGWLVDRPQEQISGYTGGAASAVWAGQLVSLKW